MGMTMTQRILARAAGRESVQAGELLTCALDLALGNDITGPPAIQEFYKMGGKRVFDPERVVLVPDHFTPNKDIASAEQAKRMREFAKEQGITHYYEVGRMGIEHALLPEQGLVAPGEVIIGADSHTCTYGAVNAFSTGVGSTDLASAMALGTAWFRVPEAISVHIKGKPRRWVGGKDVILYIIGKLGVDGARYMSLEFFGEGIESLSMDSRFSIANMAIEAGAKNGIFPVDDTTRDYLRGRVTRPWTEVLPDEDAAYTRTLEVDLDALALMVAYPHLPENTRPASEGGDITIQQSVIGSCTNGRMEDMRLAAEVLKGRRVHDDVRLLIFPATQAIYKQCIAEGLMDIFIDAGAAVSTPTCGPCLGGHSGILADGERCVSTTNRNFVGRMGHTGSEVYLAGAPVAAASAVLGHIGTPDDLEEM